MGSRETLKVLIQTLRTESRRPRILAAKTHSATSAIESFYRNNLRLRTTIRHELMKNIGSENEHGKKRIST
jgi:hypothetical protein